jgi:signal transduction histidine kinase
MYQFNMLLGIISALTCFFLFFVLVRQRPPRQDRFFFALSMLVLGFWLIINFLHNFSPSPSVGLTTFQYRAIFSLEGLAVGFLLLFGLSLQRGERLPAKIVFGVLTTALALVALNATGLVIRRGYVVGWTVLGSKFAQEEGPLYPVSVTLMGGGAILFVGLLFAKWRRSRGLERHRLAYMLWGYGTFIPLLITLSGILPAITGTDVASDYLFALSVIPYGMTTYSLIRYRLLDVRLAARRVVSRLLAAALFSLPPFLAFATLGHWLAERPNAAAGIFIGYLSLSVPMAPPVHRLLDKAISRSLFPGLFDPEELAFRATRAVAEEEDPRQGLERALLISARALRLDLLAIRLYLDEGTVLEMGWERRGNRWERADRWTRRVGRFREVSGKAGKETVDAAPEEGQRAGGAMPAEGGGISVNLPLLGLKGACGELSAEKRGGMEPLDLDFLDAFSRELGPAVENQHQHLLLLAQLERLERAREALTQSDRLGRDIILVTSHELKTPLTVIYGISSLPWMLGPPGPDLEAIRREAQQVQALADGFASAALREDGVPGGAGKEGPAARSPLPGADLPEGLR